MTHSATSAWEDYQATIAADRELRDFPLPVVQLLRSVARARGHVEEDVDEHSRAYLVQLMLHAARLAFGEAVTVSPFQLPKGRVDLAIFTPQAAIGVIAYARDDQYSLRQLKKAPAAGGFDYLLCVNGSNHRPYGDPVPAAAVFSTDWEDGELVLQRRRLDEAPSVSEHWKSERSADELLSLLLERERPRADSRACLTAADARLLLMQAARARGDLRPDTSVLMGHELASALADHLRAETPFPRAVFTEAWLGNYATDGVADCVVTTPTTISVFEIKGDRDSPTRLARQVKAYDRVGSFCTLVTTRRHLAKYRAKVPTHWGLLVAYRTTDGEIAFVRRRTAKRNPFQDAFGVTELMRTESLHDALRFLGSSVRRREVYTMRKSLSEALPLPLVVALAARAWGFRQVGSLNAQNDASPWPTLQAILAPFAPVLISDPLPLPPLPLLELGA